MRWSIVLLLVACQSETTFSECEPLGDLTGADGVALAFYHPRDVDCEAPLRVVVHDASTSSASVPEAFFADAKAVGEAVLVYDRRGFGDSEGLPGNEADDVDDLDAVMARGVASGARAITVYAVADAGRIALDQALRADEAHRPYALAFIDATGTTEANHELRAWNHFVYAVAHWQNEESYAWVDAIGDGSCEAREQDPSYVACARAVVLNAGVGADDGMGLLSDRQALAQMADGMAFFEGQSED